MSTKTFKSATRSGIAYRLSADWNWEQRGNAPLSLNLMEFETYGDGMTQHSNAYCTQFGQLADACVSIAQAFCADPANETFLLLGRMFHDTSAELLAFVQTVKHREDKEQWYNGSDRKISSAEKCRHDRRWEKVETWMDGSAAACTSLLLNIGGSGCDWAGKLCMVDDLREAMGYPLWEDIFKPTTELPHDWHQAFRAARSAAKAWREMDYARRASETALHNMANEKTAVAA